MLERDRTLPVNENVEQKFFEEERKKLIINYVNRNAKATVAELC